MKLLRYLWWSFVVGVSLGVWWLIAILIQTQPLWAISPDDKVQFHYFSQTSEKLVGIRPADIDNQWLVVFDARNGKQLSELKVPVSKSNPANSQAHDYLPRIVGDQVYRFLISNDAEMQLRSWHFAKESQEQIIARWPATFINVTGSQQTVPNLQISWSPKHPGMVLVYRHLISDELLAPLNRAGQLDLGLLMPGWRFWNTSVCQCEVWQWVDVARTMQKINDYTVPVFYRAANVPSGLPSYWSADGTHVAQVPGWGKTSPAMIWVEAATGKLREVTPYEEKQKWYGLEVADQLIMMQRFQTVVYKENGKNINLMTQKPNKPSKLTWSINEWRPLLDAKTLQTIPWPNSIDHTMIGDDHLLCDHANPTRYLHQSMTWDDSPHYQRKDGAMEEHLALLRYQNGKLLVEHQWKREQIPQHGAVVLCGDLFIQSTNQIKLPTWLQWLNQYPTVFNHYKKWMNADREYVGIFEPLSQRITWKIHNRIVDKSLPILADNRLLLRFQMAAGRQIAGYECWQLPIRTSAVGFWSGAIAALVTFCWFYWQSVRNPRKPPIPLKS